MACRASAMRRAQEGTAEEEAAAAGENGGVLMDDDEKLKVAQRSLSRRTARALVVCVALLTVHAVRRIAGTTRSTWQDGMRRMP
jgi:hypothetical protein